MSRPIFCKRCGAPWGSRSMVLPGEVTRTIPTPEGDIEAVIEDHPDIEACLTTLRQILEDEKTRARDIDRRIQMITARHNHLVDEAKGKKSEERH